MSYQYNNYYNYQQPVYTVYYVVVKKGDVYLAINHNNWENINSNYQYISLINQGCIYFWEGLATSPENAIELAKEFNSQEIIKLQQENKMLQDELNKRLQQGDVWSENPLVILGFNETDKPSPEKLKDRKKYLSNKLHPDRDGGSDFLMKLVNVACAKLGI